MNLVETKREINLLPQKMQRGRTRLLYLRKAGRLLNRSYLILMLIAVGQVAVLMFLKSLDYERLAQEKNLGNELTATEEVEQTNKLMGELEIYVKEWQSWSTRVRDILRRVPAGVRIKKIEVVEGNNALVVRGESDSRRALEAMQQGIEKIPWVERLEAPLENFALGPEAEFMLSLFEKP